MGGEICWYCHWGWPKELRDIYDWAKAELGGDDDPLHFGPAHVVWEDENWDCAEWCIENCDKGEYRRDLTDREVAIVRESLVRLTQLPAHIRYAEPADYDGQNPAKFPPAPGLVMVPR